MTKTIIGNQGEITIIMRDDMPTCENKPVERTCKGWIISHSERGHHHLLTGGEVMERVDGVPTGMRIIYALLDGPADLIQDAPVPHDGYSLPAGFYEFRIAREYNPFAQQARMVAD